MPQRVRVRVTSEPDTPSWILEVHRHHSDPGGVYEFITPERAAEIIREHEDRQRRTLPSPTPGELEAMTRPLSARGWRITRSRVQIDEFMRRALS